MSLLFQLLLFIIFIFPTTGHSALSLGADRIFEEKWAQLLKGKKIGLITNQTGRTSSFVSTIDLLHENQKKYSFTLVCLFAPEHGLYGEAYAEEKIHNTKTKSGIPVYSLHGTTMRPTKEMLKDLSLLIFDIQDIGTRSYTYATTLYYVMEEAAKLNIPVLVLDRPNPINGITIDGPMLEKEFRSFVGYINVPYCHGMTIGELANFFNKEYKVGCHLHVVPMTGWKREMTFDDTHLQWIPTSPNIPNTKAAHCYPAVGMLGQLDIAAIGGFSLPFQAVAATWIDGERLASMLNGYKLPGVFFLPTYIKPVLGRYAKLLCQGVIILITNPLVFKPYAVQCALFHALRRCYPKTFLKALADAEKKKALFFNVCGTKKLFELLKDPSTSFEQLCEIHHNERQEFIKTRKEYLLY